MSWGEQTTADTWGFGTMSPAQGTTSPRAAAPQQQHAPAQANYSNGNNYGNNAPPGGNAWGGTTAAASSEWSWGGATVASPSPAAAASPSAQSPAVRSAAPPPNSAAYASASASPASPPRSTLERTYLPNGPTSAAPASGASAVISGDARGAAQSIATNKRALEDCERKLGTREDTRALRDHMAQLRKDTLAQITAAQRALQARPDRGAADELAAAAAGFTRVAQRIEQREQMMVQSMTATLHEPSSVTQQQKQQLTDTYGLVDDALVEEYNTELRGLVQDLRGLQEAQASVNTLVTQQQSLLDVTEQNVVTADSNVTAGTAEVEETRDLACAIRWKKLIIALVVIGVLVIIAVIITVSVVTTQKKPPASPPPGPASPTPAPVPTV